MECDEAAIYRQPLRAAGNSWKTCGLQNKCLRLDKDYYASTYVTQH